VQNGPCKKLEMTRKSLKKSEYSLSPTKFAKWLESPSHGSLTRPTTTTGQGRALKGQTKMRFMQARNSSRFNWKIISQYPRCRAVFKNRFTIYYIIRRPDTDSEGSVKKTRDKAPWRVTTPIGDQRGSNRNGSEWAELADALNSQNYNDHTLLDVQI
jgi:hypothetical protein